MSWKALIASRRQSEIFVLRLKKSRASSATRGPSTANGYVHPEVLNTWTAIELKEKAESELRGDVQSFKPEEAAVLALLRSRLAKEARRPAAKKQRAKAG
jgi:hypothetical protein